MSLERSFLYVAGSDPSGVDEALRGAADAVVVDLEDTVAADAKAAARTDLLDLLSDRDGSKSCGVRVNGLDTSWGIADVEAMATADAQPDFLVVPDVRGAEEVGIVADVLDDHGSAMGLHPLIEKPSAMFEVRDVARIDERIHGLTFAAIDFQMNMGMSVLDESDFTVPRYLLSMAANAAGVLALDKPNLTAVHSEDRTRREAEAAKRLGFDGKLAMNEAQAAVINDVFTPTEAERERAERIVAAFEEADEGLVEIDGAAVDRPVVEQLRSLLERAERADRDA